jgi:RNA polymerase sigma factor (sigma-70 family)
MPSTVADDAGLVSEALTGNRDAFAQIVTRYQNLISSIVYSGTGNLARAQDLAQETFVIAWKELADLRDPSCLRSWLCGIARRRMLKNHRQAQREPSHLAEPLEAARPLPCPKPTPADEVMRNEEEHLVWRSLERMPESYRDALILFYREDQSVEQVARSLGLSQDAAKQRLCRGRKLLRDEITTLMERVLKRTRPGDDFTALVLAALPSSPASIKRGLVALLASKSPLATWVSFLSVLGGGYVGWKAEMATARSEREHRFLARKAAVLCLGVVVIFLGLHFGWRTLLGSLASRFGHDLAQISLLFGLAILFLVQQGYFSARQRRIRVEDGTSNLPDPIAFGPTWRVSIHVGQRMAALMLVMALIAIQAASEQEWIAATVGFLLIPSFLWLGVRRWHSCQRDEARAVFRGMIGTVVGFFCLTLLQYDLPRLYRGTLGWNAATLATNLAVALLYGILFMAVYATRARSQG